MANLCGYLLGTVMLHKTELRRQYFASLMKYSYLYLFYSRVYPHSHYLLPASAFYGAILNKTLFCVNKFVSF